MLPINKPRWKPRLTVNTGSMFSGKSSELLRQGKRHIIAGDKVLFVKPNIDSRYAEDEIVTHDGKKVPAIKIGTIGKLDDPQILEADVVLIDEAQFFSGRLSEEVGKLLKLGKVVYCSGLDMDFQGSPFETVMRLMGIADTVTKFNAVCDQCGDDAYVSAKFAGSKSRVELGSAEKYKPLCRSCYNSISGEEI